MDEFLLLFSQYQDYLAPKLYRLIDPFSLPTYAVCAIQ
jgi:hypothetical protein